jgi:PAS domain S-box-containing protein
MILVALLVGMSASGVILLSAMPAAAYSYMSAILLPSTIKGLIFLHQKEYVLLGVLALSYWWFLAALIAKIKREISERQQADVALKESEARLHEALSAGQVVAFSWDSKTCLSQRSGNASKILGIEPQTGTDRRRNNFLAQVHRDDRGRFVAQLKRLCPKSPSYSTSFRFIRPDGREIWLEETGKAVFDTGGRALRFEGLTIDITQRKQAELRQELLVSELDHRVKNTLARVASLTTQARQSSSSLDEFAKIIEGRIQAMASAHALLSQTHWSGVNLVDLVHGQIAPYSKSTRVSGPNIVLNVAATQAVAMVLHELATNAVKYGALSTPDGQVLVNWDRVLNGNAAANVMLEWREIGGPPVAAPVQSGFGTSLIRDLIPHELGGTVDLAFRPDGVYCKIEFPT